MPPSSTEAAQNGEIEMVIPYQLHGLTGSNGVLSTVEVATLDGAVKSLPADVLLPFFGLSMDLGPIAAWGLQSEKHHVTIDPATCQTSYQASSRSATSPPIPAS